jgi:hypothetical protein
MGCIWVSGRFLLICTVFIYEVLGSWVYNYLERAHMSLLKGVVAWFLNTSSGFCLCGAALAWLAVYQEREISIRRVCDWWVKNHVGYKLSFSLLKFWLMKFCLSLDWNSTKGDWSMVHQKGYTFPLNKVVATLCLFVCKMPDNLCDILWFSCGKKDQRDAGQLLMKLKIAFYRWALIPTWKCCYCLSNRVRDFAPTKQKNHWGQNVWNPNFHGSQTRTWLFHCFEDCFGTSPLVCEEAWDHGIDPMWKILCFVIFHHDYYIMRVYDTRIWVY